MDFSQAIIKQINIIKNNDFSPATYLNLDSGHPKNRQTVTALLNLCEFFVFHKQLDATDWIISDFAIQKKFYK